jgi:hypothetical protein
MKVNKLAISSLWHWICIVLEVDKYVNIKICEWVFQDVGDRI